MTPSFRTHQHRLDEIVRAIGSGDAAVRDILAAVTPGGGKSLLPVIAAARLIATGIVDRICWIVPRDTLRLQAEEAFVDPAWRAFLGHGLTIRTAENRPDPCRDQAGYVTTYQAIAAAPAVHLAEFRRHRYLVVIDELHHLPGLADADPAAGALETAWSRAIAPLLEMAEVRLLMSGTLERADSKAILGLPYRRPKRARKAREIDFRAPGWATVGYSRRQALAERAILPVTFGALDGAAEWLTGNDRRRRVGSLAGAALDARDALFTALRTEYAESMLRIAFEACRQHRQQRRQALGLGPKDPGRGLGKLLVVAPDQATAWQYAARLQSWTQRCGAVRLATSRMADAHEAIAAFRRQPEPAVLVTVAMAYEGMDCPEVSHVVALTHIRSRPWLEQMIARATRVDPFGGPYDAQRATVYHPDDPMFRTVRAALETDQATRAEIQAAGPVRSPRLPFDEDRPKESAPGIVPLRSNVTTLQYAVLAPGPDFDPIAAARGHLETPSAAERRLRTRVGQMIADQVVEDEALGLTRPRQGYHAYNAALRRILGKSRAAMTLAELEAAVGWLERNRLRDHVQVLDKDAQYGWSRTRQKWQSAARRRWKAG